MRVCFDTFLETLGCNVTGGVEDAHPCPVCRNVSPSLHILNPTGIHRFYCTACAFEGGVIQLVAQARELTQVQALELFKPGQEFSHTFADDCPERHRKEYITRQQSQAFLKDYALRSHQALNGSSTDGYMCRVHLEVVDKILQTAVPVDMGVLIHDGIPHELRKLDQQIYQQSPHLLHFYTYAGEITGVAVAPLLEPEKREYIAIQEGGLYVADHSSTSESILYVTQSERFTTGIFSLHRHYTAAPTPVVCVHSLPLPFEYRNLRRIYLINHPSGPLTLAQAFLYITKEQLITGTGYRPDVRVIDAQGAIPDVTRIRRLREISVTAVSWVARELRDLYESEGPSATARLLSELPPLNNIKDEVIGKLQHRRSPDALVKMIQEPQAYHGDCAVLTNRSMVYRNDSGFEGVSARVPGDRFPLGNVRFETLEIIRDRGNRLHYRMSLRAKGYKPVAAVFDISDFNNANRLRRAVAVAYAAAGIDVHVGIYDSRGFDWREIRAAFNDKPAVHDELQEYGISPALDLELPNLVITNRGTSIRPQTKILAPPACTPVYAGIRPYQQRSESLGAFKVLWEDTSFNGMALSICISHIIACILQGVQYRAAGQIPPGMHLMLADPSEHTWETVHSQLNELLSGSPEPCTYVTKNPLKKYKELGCLPLPVNMCAVQPKSMPTVMRGTPVSLIGLCTDMHAVKISERPRTSFIMLASTPETKLKRVHHMKIAAMRQSIADLLRLAMECGADMPRNLLRDAEVPALAVYKYLAPLLKAEPVKEVEQLVKPYYNEYSANVVDYFFMGLQHVLRDKKKYKIMKGFPENIKERIAAVYICNDTAAIETRLLRAINAYLSKEHDVTLSKEGIHNALRDHGFTTAFRTRGMSRQGNLMMWMLKLSVWQTRVMGLGRLEFQVPESRDRPSKSG